jgi:hypothetical protein
LEHLDYFSITIGKNNANWWTQSFFRWVGLNHQPVGFVGGRRLDDIFFWGDSYIFRIFSGRSWMKRGDIVVILWDCFKGGWERDFTFYWMGMAKPIVWWNHVDMAMENTPFIEFIVDFCMKSHAYKGISHFFFLWHRRVSPNFDRNKQSRAFIILKGNSSYF